MTRRSLRPGRPWQAGDPVAILLVAAGLSVVAGEPRAAPPVESAKPPEKTAGTPQAPLTAATRPPEPLRLPDLEERLVQVVEQVFSGPRTLPLQRERGLDAAAWQNCLDLADRPVDARPGAERPLEPEPGLGVDPARLRYRLAQAGVPDADVQPLALSGTSEPRLSAGLRRLLRQPPPGGRPAPSHVGVAALRGQDGLWVTVLLLRRLVRLEPLPFQVQVGDALRLRGELADGARSARLLYSGPAGRVEELALVAGGGLFSGEMPFLEGMGAYDLQLLVETDRGPEVAASWRIYAGMPPPAGPVVKMFPRSVPGAPPEQVEEQALALLNRDRLRRGLPALRLHPLLALAARRHSEQMRDRHFFSHLSPEQIGPEQRLASLGLRCEREAENISIAADVAQAHALLMGSPSHRRNILDPELTDVGLGAAWDESPVRSLFLTQLFARLPEPPAGPRDVPPGSAGR